MEIIDRYIYAVTKRLPPTQREDIEKELKGLIQDMMARESNGKEAGRKEAEAVLRELGDPALLADSYRDKKRYLIGPEMFDLYILILKIVIPVSIFGVALGLSLEMAVNPPLKAIEGASSLLSAIFTTALSVFAWVTIIFSIVEIVNSKKHADISKKEWKPSDLPYIPPRESFIKRSEPVAGIVFSVLFFVVFIFASDLLGIYQFDNGKLVSVAALFDEDRISQVLPLLALFFSAGVLKECIKLIVGRWTPVVGAANALLNIVSLILCIVIFSDPAVWNNDLITELYNQGTISAHRLESLTSLWERVTGGLIYLISFGFIVDSLASIYKSMKAGK